MGVFGRGSISGPTLVATAASATGGGGSSLFTNRVECFGAKSVAFYVRSVTDSDVWATATAALPSMVGPDGAVNSSSTAFKTGYTCNLALNSTAANVGTFVYLTPLFSGSTNDPNPDGRIISQQAGLQLT